VSWAIETKGYSQRRACGLVGIDPRVHRYRSTREDDAELRSRLKALAAERRRFGYRRLHILLRREGVNVNWKKLYRVYREERLTVRKRGGRKRALGTRAPMAVPQEPNQRWSLDFVSDTLVDGRRFQILCVIDDYSRECLAVIVDNSLSGERVARELDAIAEHRDYPCMVVSDNGTELTSNAMLKWRQERGVEWHYIAPGKPMQNGFVEHTFMSWKVRVRSWVSGRVADSVTICCASVASPVRSARSTSCDHSKVPASVARS
jgi:putative transposase